MVEALHKALDAEADLALSQTGIKEPLRLQKLVDFQLVLKHDFSTADCKNLNHTYALLLFKIALPDGSVSEKRMEVSLPELAQIKQELVRIGETLA